MTITEHVTEQERKEEAKTVGEARMIMTPVLRKACENPLVRLEVAAKQMGMDRKEVMRALQFLHKTGSVLPYTAREVEREIPETCRNSLALQNRIHEAEFHHRRHQVCHS
jgi:hypothetical protein